MGNYIEASVNLLLKSLPTFITYEQIIAEDGDFEKQTELKVNVEFDMHSILMDLDLLYPHSTWCDGEEIIYEKENFYEAYSCPKELIDGANYFMWLRLCSKSGERRDNYLALVEKLKPHLVDGHPNILGQCHDEDVHRENNFTIVIDEIEFKKLVLENQVFCEGCRHYNDQVICLDVEQCKRAFEIGKQMGGG